MKSYTKWADENLNARDMKALRLAWTGDRPFAPRRRLLFAELGIILIGTNLFTPFGQRLCNALFREETR